MQKILNYTRHIKVIVRDITLTSKKDFPFPEFCEGIPLHPILREMLTHYIGNDVYAINLIVGYYMDIKEPIPLEDILKILKHSRAIREFMDRLKDVTLKDKPNNLISPSKEKKAQVLNKEEIFLKIRALVAEEFNLAEDKIGLESRFKEDLGLDSVDAIELVMVVEEAFDFEMPDEDIEKINKVSELVDYISFKVYKNKA